MNIKDVEVHRDSIFIISQFTNIFEVKNPILIKYRRCITHLCQFFRSISFNYIPRSKDALATIYSCSKYLKKLICVQSLSKLMMS